MSIGRRITGFLTGRTDDADAGDAAARRSEPTPRAERVATPAAAAGSAPAPASAHRADGPALSGPPPAPSHPGEDRVALPDFVAPPGTEIVAGVDENGVEYVFEDDPYSDPLVDPRYDADDRNWVRYRPYWGGYLRFAIIGFIAVALVFVARDRAYDWIDGEIVPDGPQGEDVEITIQTGASTNDVAALLDDEGVIGNATVFRYWLRCDGDITILGFLGCDTERTFQAGDYVLNENMAFADVVTELDEGPIPEVVFTITFPEGLRVGEFIEVALAENERFDREDLGAALFDPELLSSFVPPEVDAFHWFEGTLFPATYDIPESDLADEAKLVDRMTDEFDTRFTKLLAENPKDPVIEELGLTDFQLITIASLIEEEARIPEDRPKMARAIYNRLLAGDQLGIDASTYYAVNKPYTEPLTAEDLANPSPWNTRASSGIPPTPIAAPGEASLLAALQPEPGDYYYWVRTDEGGVPGAHTFSVTEAEHQAAIEVCVEIGICQ